MCRDGHCRNGGATHREEDEIARGHPEINSELDLFDEAHVETRLSGTSRYMMYLFGFDGLEFRRPGLSRLAAWNGYAYLVGTQN